MVELDTLIEYQKVDIELRRILDEIERHDYSKKLNQAKQEFALAKAQVTNSENDAEKIIAFFNKSMQYFEKTSKKAEELSAKLEAINPENEKELKEAIDELEQLRDKLASLEKEIGGTRNKSETVIKNYLDAQERGKKLRDIYNNTKAMFDSFKNEKEPKINELTLKLEKMKPGIDKDLFAKYYALTQERKYPALVEAGSTDNGKNYSCFGCGLELSQKVKSELIEKNICACENCRRIIYKK